MRLRQRLIAAYDVQDKRAKPELLVNHMRYLPFMLSLYAPLRTLDSYFLVISVCKWMASLLVLSISTVVDRNYMHHLVILG